MAATSPNTISKSNDDAKNTIPYDILEYVAEENATYYSNVLDEKEKNIVPHEKRICALPGLKKHRTKKRKATPPIIHAVYQK